MIPEELMKKVRELEIVTGRAVNEVFAGEYSSAFKGRGMEFAEVRLYQPGDDVRTIDWNVTARSGAPHVKRYVEERELTVVLAVDLSASGRFGSTTRPKNALAAELCAILAFAATRNNDKAGLLIFTDRVELFVPPRKGARHVLRIIREVLSFGNGERRDPGVRTAAGGTSLTVALDHLLLVLKRSAVVFLVSDFLTDELPPPIAGDRAPDPRRARRREAFDAALRAVSRRHDLVAVRVADPREHALPDVGLIELRDAERGTRRLLDTSSAAARRAFEALAARRDKTLQQQLARVGADYVGVSTGRPYFRALVELFKRRERRR